MVWEIHTLVILTIMEIEVPNAMDFGLKQKGKFFRYFTSLIFIICHYGTKINQLYFNFIVSKAEIYNVKLLIPVSITSSTSCVVICYPSICQLEGVQQIAGCNHS